MRTPRLIATDLDGTVLLRDGTLSPRTLRALRAAAAAGTGTVVVSARPTRSVRRVAAVNGLTGTAICGNGAVVCDLGSGATLLSRPLDTAVARDVAQALADAVPGVAFAVETGEQLLCTPRFTMRFEEPSTIEVDVSGPQELWACREPVLKLLAWSPTLDADTLLAAADRAAAGRVQCTHSGGRGLVEITAAGVTKASTLAAWCASRGITAEEVVAFGDMPNDLPMLAWAGAGWAMGNAHPAVLAAVPRHTLSIGEDGVAAVLERLFAPEPTVAGAVTADGAADADPAAADGSPDPDKVGA
ncbi:HAD family hydrolase [Streptantibioticus silvisoli]|uniref:HAD family hydrolase n=1 Tax=Streptantibioticus silvisoli TaxID=2705255 RepID=A0ABT6W0T4_9ACTN|nr:HAD family hydrolase [Streptantibioticus silvisoli]MDI5964357.1 HAD family hydrolase [Streptantibioticus silvisoli]